MATSQVYHPNAQPLPISSNTSVWTIENRSHWVRDVVFGEDASEVRAADIPAIMATLRNTAIALLRFAGYTHIAKTTRFLAAKPKQALKLLTHVF